MEAEREKYREALSVLAEQAQRAYDIAEAGGGQRSEERFLSKLAPAWAQVTSSLISWRNEEGRVVKESRGEP